MIDLIIFCIILILLFMIIEAYAKGRRLDKEMKELRFQINILMEVKKNG